MTVLVAGATGSIGKEVVAALLARGAGVRALVRTAGRADVLPPGVEPAVGDLRDPAAVTAALTGATAALYVSPHDPDEERMADVFVTACDALGVRLVFAGVALTARSRLARLSMEALVSTFLPHYRGKLRVARRVAAARQRPTVLGVANYYQNDEVVRAEILDGRYPLPTHRNGVNRVDLRDVGEVAARALTDDAFPAGAFALAGPESVSGARAARVWSEALGRPVRYDGDRPDWPDVLARHLSGAKLADYRRSYGFVARFHLPAPARDIARTAELLGRPPRTYESYVRDTAADWSSSQRPVAD
ncbi:NAD(P)H-binding protein [Dactylosporangium sp. NPDC049742]|uniref:NmrA family NAD(P)-binding protein n=1 Tax=Dactylosporangium sp. NPDC049742 TaxID=3154737 RepID=UPI00341C9FC3